MSINTFYRIRFKSKDEFYKAMCSGDWGYNHPDGKFVPVPFQFYSSRLSFTSWKNLYKAQEHVHKIVKNTDTCRCDLEIQKCTIGKIEIVG